MARKSRFAPKEITVRSGQRMFKAGLYVRLSVLDGGRKESDTVKTQEAVLRKFVEGKPYFTVTSVYVDNGETGTNFKRSEFERLIDDVKGGTIDCIIVKDLSRFGRNYIEAGEYLEKIFPFLGVRFIAVNDHYDSIDPSASDILTMHLKNLVNDIYARDLSQKICPVMRGKQERGEYIGNWAPYGYLKSSENKNKLIVDPETAPVVRDIFGWRLEGVGYRSIAKKLTELEIPPPGRYRYEKGISKDKRQINTPWLDRIVIGILASQAYMGHTVQGKHRRALWKGEKRTFVPKEQWIVARNTHEAIIDEATFTAVQKINRTVNEQHKAKRKIPVTGSCGENILHGIVVCGNCGIKLKHFKRSRENKNVEPHFRVWYSYNCRTHMEKKENCPFTSINEQSLFDVVFEVVKMQIMAVADMERFMKQKPYLDKAALQKQVLMKEIKQVTEQLTQVFRHKESLYDDYAEGLMGEQDYVYAQKRYQNKEESFCQRLGELEGQLSSIPVAGTEETTVLEAFLRFKDKSCLTREMAAELIDQVVVYDRNNIAVKLRFEDEFCKLKEKLASLMEVVSDA